MKICVYLSFETGVNLFLLFYARQIHATLQAVNRIDWPEGFCRRDIGWRAVDKKCFCHDLK
jgi:hypothetical protein